ncbi:MAG: S-adenosylmethionine decarboxylase proenzyme [Candidatus Magasanikbacteria bacterium GW2011_GWC2_37_14]|uniref:S-adenosylmethionine decarboxylase proenzyme n=1 Tax=Candidatus Magasanikbacteria bacterium GW2011_GWC2_37_14 TaxID=1619046 RepID=A0A0G0G8G4_9BACT|nr:MAG: S-adenosylmethionine decarboxylase proenzyme [Candidatus Magasanikbacteria bacterium GW2011_GWC2_37_14]
MLKNLLNKISGIGNKGHFGIHLTIDGYRGDPVKLNNLELVFRCLHDLPELVGMKKLSEPLIVEAPPVNEKDSGGISGFVMINTSHISCHTFPKRKFVSIDVYTCKEELDENFVINYFKEVFSLEEVEVHSIKRGTKYPCKDLI